MNWVTKSGWKVFVAACLAVIAGSVHAQLLTVYVNGNIDTSTLYPIAVANFAGETSAPQPVAVIVREDLQRSGKFTNIDAGGAPVAETAQVNLGAWKAKGANAFVAGSVNRLQGGDYQVRFRLYDTASQKNLGGLTLVAPADGLRMNAHKVADYIYQTLFGTRGVFATRLSYVLHSGTRYLLQISDSDGQNVYVALSSPEPIISPTWSPDGTKVAYVSFEKDKPIVYVHDLPTGQRFMISDQKGDNSAPAWSPDGHTLALALSMTGNTQIFSINAQGGDLHRLSHSAAIDTEPTYSPNGQWIYFTSDRDGSPRIYRMPAQGEDAGIAQRVTFHGNYNTSPRISPDGKTLAYISRVGGGFRLYTQDLQTGEAMAMTSTTHDESPSFAANGQYILYGTRENGRNVLAAVSIDGRARQVLSVQGGSVSEPSWGPFMQ